MISIGEIVDATVVRVEPYGVYLQVHDGEILVLIPEIAWCPTTDPHVVAPVGSVHRVRILAHSPEHDIYTGSFRLVDPEQNPYRRLAASQSEVHAGTVRNAFGDRITVDLDGLATGHIPADEQTAFLKSGDRVTVEVASVDVESQSLVLRLAAK